MKLHLRILKIHGVIHRLVTLRPCTEVAFSTNYFHETWHILSDRHGSQLLARLMWGLSFQREPNTAVLIHGEHIKPTPFGAERSDPILIMLDTHAGANAKALRTLNRRFSKLGPSDRTVRWKTFGLDAALSKRTEREPRDWSREFVENEWMWYDDSKPMWESEAMFRRGGFVCYQAPSRIMQSQASTIATMNPGTHGMDYHYLAERNDSRWPSGEVQIFDNYAQRCSAAREARRSVLNAERKFADEQGLYEAVAAKRDQLLRQRRASQRIRRAAVSTNSKPANRKVIVVA